MVIASCAYMLDPLIKELRRLGIPFHNPYRKTNGRWNPLKYSKDSLSAADRICAFLLPQPAIFGEDAAWWTYAHLWSWVEAVQAKCLPYGVKSKIERHAKEAPDVHVPKETFLQWFPDDAINAPVLAGDLTWFYKYSTKTAQNRLSFAVEIAKRRGAKLLKEKPQLTVGTIHSVKGGEAHCVWLFPDLSPRGEEEWNESRAGNMSIRRVFYVAMTRAREKLVLCEPSGQRAVFL